MISKFNNFFNCILQSNTDLNFDYLNINSNVDVFDWDKFFEKYHENLVYEMFEKETFQIIKDEQQKNNRRHIEYSFKIKEFEFRGIVDAVTCESEIDSLNQDIVKFEMKRQSTTLIKELLNVYKNNPQKFIIKYKFIDSDNNTFITNKLGNYAFFVLRTATKCLLDAMSKVGVDNVLGLEFHVAKSEYKRLDLYKKLISNAKINFDQSFEDDISDLKYITYYTWKD